MVSDGVLVIPGYNLHYAEKHTVCWQHWREGGRIGKRREAGRGRREGGGVLIFPSPLDAVCYLL